MRAGDHPENGRVRLAVNYKQTKDLFFANASFAEQENSALAVLKKIAAHCRPDTLLWLVRLFLYKLAKRKSQTWKKR